MSFESDLQYCKDIEKIVQYFINGKFDKYYTRDYERDTPEETHCYNGLNVHWDSTIFYLTIGDNEKDCEFSFEHYEYLEYNTNTKPITDKDDNSYDTIEIPLELDMTEEKHFQYSTMYTERQLRAITLFWYLNKNNSPSFYLDTEMMPEYLTFMKEIDDAI